MRNKSALDRFLDATDPSRRGALQRMLAGAMTGGIVYTAPVIVSCSLAELGGVAHAQVANQVAVPTLSPVEMVVSAGLVGAAGALHARRSRRRKG